MIKYLSLDVIDVSSSPYPDSIKHISIKMRGTKNLFDIFFSAFDVETSFEITLPPQIDFTWINTPSGKDKYLSYPTLKRMLFQLNDKHPSVPPYLAWVDSLLFANSKIKPFFRHSVSSIQISDDTESLSDLDDTASIQSFCSIKDDEFVVTALQHKVDQLEHKLELTEKDIDILKAELKFKNKEIELLNLRLRIPVRSDWI